MPRSESPLLRLGHSPDPDDAFMWWPLFELNGAPPRVKSDHFRFAPVTADIESLNRRSQQIVGGPADQLEITAISCAQYPYVQDKYVLTACGASMGAGYGPKLIANQSLHVDDLVRSRPVIAIPGERTSAFAATVMRLGSPFRYEVVPFETIIDRVADRSFTAGLIIHEGQLTFAHHPSGALHLVEDLGAWWWKRWSMPLPLGVNVVRRDLEGHFGEGTLQHITDVLLQSVQYALSHRDESIAYAMQFGRGLGLQDTDEFISMYVNKWTLNFGDEGLRAVEHFLAEASRAGVTPPLHRTDTLQASVMDNI